MVTINILLWERYKINNRINSLLKSIPEITIGCYNIINYCERLEEELERTKQWNKKLTKIIKKNE